MKLHFLTAAAALVLCAVSLPAEDKKFLPGQASNDDIELHGTVLLSPEAIHQAVGAELPEGYIVVRMEATPKIAKPIRISPDDFTLISRKDGDRSSALSPSQIAGRGALVVHPAKSQPGGLGTVTNGPVWGGVGGTQPQKFPGQSNGIGNGGSVENGTAEAHIDTEKGETENPLLAVLKSKAFPDKATQEPLEGLLYFVLETKKLKPKDLGMIYKGAAGRLVIDFQ